MNVTFRLLTDLGDFPWYVFVVILVFVLGWLYLGYRAVRTFEKLVTLYGQRKESTAIVWPSSSTPGTSSQVGQTSQEVRRSTAGSVPDIPPEVILKRAPKPVGFGGPSNGNKQPEQPNSAEGSDDQKGDTTSKTSPAEKI